MSHRKQLRKGAWHQIATAFDQHARGDWEFATRGPGSEPFLGSPNLAKYAERLAAGRDQRQEAGVHGRQRKSSQESYQGPDRGQWHQDEEPEGADVPMAAGVGGECCEAGTVAHSGGKGKQDSQGGSAWRMGGRREGGGGPKRRSDCSGEGKAGKGPWGVLCQGHRDAKVRVDIPGGCPVGRQESHVPFLIPCTPMFFSFSGVRWFSAALRPSCWPTS